MTSAMLRWKEHHYARATEFAQLLAEALAHAPAPMPHAPAATVPRPAPTLPKPRPAAPTAAAVFKAIPWKK
jgi:hypothetical protein